MKIDNVDILSLNLDASKSAMLNDNFTRSLNLAPPYLDASTIVGPVESIIEQVKGVVDAFATTALSALQMIDNIFDVVLKGIGKIIELLNSVIKIVTGLFRPHKWMSTVIDGLTSACEWLTKVRSQFSNKTAGITTKIGEIQIVCKDAIEDGKKIFIKKVNKILKAASEWLKVVFDWIKKQLSSFEKWLKGLAISGIEKLQKKKEERLKKEAEDRLLAETKTATSRVTEIHTAESSNPDIQEATNQAKTASKQIIQNQNANVQAKQSQISNKKLTKEAAINAGWKEVKTVTYEFSSACSEQIKIDFNKIQWKHDVQPADSTTYSGSTLTSTTIASTNVSTGTYYSSQLRDQNFQNICQKWKDNGTKYGTPGSAGSDGYEVQNAKGHCAGFTYYVAKRAWDIDIGGGTVGQWSTMANKFRLFKCTEVSVKQENNKTQLQDGDLLLFGKLASDVSQSQQASCPLSQRKLPQEYAVWQGKSSTETYYITHVGFYSYEDRVWDNASRIGVSQSSEGEVTKLLKGGNLRNGKSKLLGIGRFREAVSASTMTSSNISVNNISTHAIDYGFINNSKSTTNTTK